MRPYLAIIKDSFREALASRVLWVLLGLTTALLLAMAPLGIRLNLTTKFARGDIAEGPQLVAKMRKAAAADGASPGKRLWSLMDEEAHARLIRLERSEVGEERDFFVGMDALRSSLNKLLERRDLYDEETWKGVSLTKEAKNYLAKPRADLTEDELARLNRLLVENAFRAHFHSRSGQSIALAWLWFKSDPLPFSKEQTDTFIKEWVLSSAMSWIVGVFGMMAAILVTSTIIPQMFDPGSITLLLSKPVSRSLLFISKFLGACAFILLNVSYLIVGLWLIAGLRFGIWNQGMLWCIPIFLFMFLVYYAVSALAGVIWKSAVISVVMTVMFWVVCWGLDVTSSVMEAIWMEPNRIIRIAEADGSLITVTEEGQMQVWDDAELAWRDVYEPPGRGGQIPTIDGPIYHAKTKQLLVGQGFSNPFGVVGHRITLRVSRARDGWALRDGPALPAGTANFLVEPSGSVLAIAADNVFRLEGEPGPATAPVKVFGVTILRGAGQFRPILKDPDVNFVDPIAAAADPLKPRIVVVSGNDVTLLTLDADRRYVVAASRKLTGNEKGGAAVGIAGSLVVVAREDGTIWLLSSDDLSVRQETKLEAKTQPRFIAVAPDSSRIAILFQNRRLWLIDPATGKAMLAPIRAQNQISAVGFTADKMLIGDYPNRAITYDLKTLRLEQTFYPRMSQSEQAYYYFVAPLHAIFPKPRLLDNTVHYALTGKRTTSLGMFQGDIQQRREDLHPWRPVYSGLAFVATVLLIACIYIERHEF